jgi:GMP synthase-like glutamine amidotransferase
VARVLVVQHDDLDPVGRLGEWLSAGGAELVICDAGAGDAVPETPAGYDGLIVLGGFLHAQDDAVAPWLPAVRRLLATAVADEVPTLGVCLGAQLLALALGGQVGPNPDGPEYGAQLIAKRAASATDPLFGTMPITPDIIQWHEDAVLQLPPGAQLLASSPGCDVQAFRIGRVAWGLQGHIETTAEQLRTWARADAEALEDYDVERLLTRAEAVLPDIGEVWPPFVRSFLGVVEDPDSVAKPRGVATTTAEPITDPAAIRAALAEQMQAAHQPPTNLPPTDLPWPSRDR